MGCRVPPGALPRGVRGSMSLLGIKQHPTRPLARAADLARLALGEVAVRRCDNCRAENGEQAMFCRACGGALPETTSDRVCEKCGAQLREGAAFCGACGAGVDTGPATGGSRLDARLAAILGGVVLFVGVVAVAALLVLRGGGDDGDGRGDVGGGLVFEAPVELSARAKADLAAAVAALPEPVGDTDAEQIRSILGPPDVFQLWFDPLDGGGAARSEVWYYLNLEVSYEFRDGVLLFTIPMEDVGGLLLIPLRYDPLDFSPATTVADVRAMLDDPAALIPEVTPPDYQLGVTVWAGEHLMAAFDTDGELLYVETVAVDLGGGG